MTPHEVIKKSVQEFEQAYPDIESGIDNYGTYCDIRNRHYDLYKALLLSVKEMVDRMPNDKVNGVKHHIAGETMWLSKKDLQSLLDEEINKVKEL